MDLNLSKPASTPAPATPRKILAPTEKNVHVGFKKISGVYKGIILVLLPIT